MPASTRRNLASSSGTTSLVTAGAEVGDLIGGDEPADQVLEEPDEDAAMDVREGPAGRRGGKGRRRQGRYAGGPGSYRRAWRGRDDDGGRPSVAPDSGPARTRP